MSTKLHRWYGDLVFKEVLLDQTTSKKRLRIPQLTVSKPSADHAQFLRDVILPVFQSNSNLLTPEQWFTFLDSTHFARGPTNADGFLSLSDIAQILPSTIDPNQRLSFLVAVMQSAPKDQLTVGAFKVVKQQF